MPTEETTSTDTPTETAGDQQPGQQQSTSEPEGNGTQQSGTPAEPTKLPDDHPLVKTLASQKATLASQKDEIRTLQATSKQVTQLEEELKSRPTKESVEQLQGRYDRLEAFIQAAGGTIGRALDSRTFTRDLFETDKDIESIVKDFHKANPTATSAALSTTGGQPADGKADPNKLIRAAWGGGQ